MLARQGSAPAVIRFRSDRAEELAAAHGLKTLTEKAAFFNITRFTYNRVLEGDARPGEEFIAAVLSSPAALAFPDEVTFDKIFVVVVAE